MFNRKNHRDFWLCGLVFILVAIATANMESQNAKTAKSQSANSVEVAKEIRIRGHLVCLAEAMHDLYRADLPADHEHLYGFKTTDGAFYTLLRTNLSEALFVDKRLHQKTLIITGRTFPKTHLLEAIRLESVHDGAVHDLYYYCDTCAIRTAAPGDCVCCQAPVELVEKPVKLTPLPD
ncbi:hypothetical protein F4X33_11680 [Candidatus Poribacteria bacterium]|nr:hypothetical protein [Candidatus Poribacteria bacterium]